MRRRLSTKGTYMMADLNALVATIADALVSIDGSGIPFRAFQAGVGPYGEPQLVKEIANRLNQAPSYQGHVVTKRTPDLLVRDKWALEFKIVRPFGDNGKEAENWSVNILHPYAGNTSSLGDCLKLLALDLPERKAVLVIGYEHNPPQITIQPLISGFELLASRVMGVDLGPREEAVRKDLVHPVHQQVTVFAWEVLGRKSGH
jgi:hypothetical protein